MKQYNKLFAILFAVLGASMSAKADTSILKSSDGWQKLTVMPTNIGDYYYVFVDKSKDLMLTMAVGANQGSSYYAMYYKNSANPLQHKASLWTIEGSNYTIRNAEYTNFAMQTEWGAAWNYRTHDQPNACEWTATIPTYSLSEACWTIQNGKYPDSGYLGPWNEEDFNDGAELAFNKSGNSIGKFHIYAISKTYCKEAATSATNANPVDMTVLMKNSDAALAVIGMEGWTTANTITRNNNNGYDGKSGFFEFCNWNGNYWEGSMTQTISSLPNGKYKVRATGQASATDVVLTLTANGVSTNLNCIGDKGGNISADGSEVASGTGVAGWQYMEVECVVVNGELTISSNSVGSAQYRWANIDNFSVYYYGKDLTTYEDALNDKIDAAETIIAEAKLNTYAKSNLTNEINAAESALKDASRTVESLEKQTELLDAAIKLANETTALYTEVSGLITVCESILNNSVEFEEGAMDTFTAATNSAKDKAETAETAEAINTIYNTLEDARRTYIQRADPLNGTLFDYTFMVTNPGFDDGTNGWECVSDAQNKQIATNKTNGIITGAFFENWHKENFNGTISQSISGLPSGKYLLKVAAFGNGAYAFANDEKTTITTSDGAWYEVEVAVSEGTLTFGIKNESATDWMGIDNVSLSYKGFDVETAKTGITSVKSRAEELAGKPMNKDVLSSLNTAITDATSLLNNSKATRKELNAMMETLNETIENANASIADYELIKTYIGKAKAFSAEIVTTYETGYNNGSFADAETVRQELNVATANYVKENFKNEIALTDWGAAGGNAMWSTQGEHWDGTGSTQYYDASSANSTHTLSKTVELTPGTYIFRGAGRAHPNTTLSLSVSIDGIEPAVFNAKNNTGRGIDKEGNATFADDAQYAKDGQGQGWEWEFIKFTLDETTTVTLTATCQTSGWGWASFANNGLWMDEATYVKAQAITLNKAKTQAQALVDTKPMGSAENSALKAAISQAEGTIDTAEEMNNALEALNTAVGNANKWVDSYYNAKGLLVAALERFESEFNDGENGALRFIPTDIWGNIIDRVMDAAQAKDLLDDYSSFSQTATDLHAAMNAVFESYIRYGMLEEKTSLIGNADCTDNAAWSGTGRSTYEDQHWSGSTRVYFTQNHENGAARTQTITLPKAGTYLLKASVRAVEAASYAEFIINGVSYRTTGAHGRVGGTIATDGSEWESVEAGIAEGKNFANDNKGYGWVYTYIYFDGKAGENTIAINLSNCNSGREANCGGMELYYLRPNYNIVEENIVKHYGEFAESITATHTTHDVTNATLANKAIIVSANPNTLIISNEGQVNNASNVIIDGTAAKLSLTDGYAFHTTANFTAGALSYNREFTKDTWLTVCLPFAYTIPENVKVETLSEIDTDTKTFTFDEVTGTMEANKPYIVKNSTEAAALFASLNGTNIKATPEAMNVTVDGSEGEFIGTYTAKTSTELMENGTYDILFFGTDGQLYYLSQGVTTKVVTFKPFRAYIRLPKGDINWADGQQARVRHRAFGEATDIENPESTIQDSQFIYDLMGRKVSTMEKGKMYIVNGKKVIR